MLHWRGGSPTTRAKYMRGGYLGPSARDSGRNAGGHDLPPPHAQPLARYVPNVNPLLWCKLVILMHQDILTALVIRPLISHSSNYARPRGRFLYSSTLMTPFPMYTLLLGSWSSSFSNACPVRGYLLGIGLEQHACKL